MIRALAHSKDRTINLSTEDGSLNSLTVNFRSIYPDIEDFFTASVFSRLCYLSKDEWTQVFGIDFGELLYREFWPRWKDVTGIQKQIEPDVFLRFENFDLIIEAKRTDGFGQYSEQIYKETEAYCSKYDNKNAYIFLVGGRGKEVILEVQSKSNSRIRFLAFEWQEIFEKIKRMNINRFLKEDILLAFELHGIRSMLFFDTLINYMSEKMVNIDSVSAIGILTNLLYHESEWQGMGELKNIEIDLIKYKEILKW